MGIFSGPGVGKSTLMSSIAKNTSADVSVVALIGERGREVQEFVENSLGEEGLKRCVVIVATGDDAPLLRGFGESSDAHHMSSPHPEGLGARLAMQRALDGAGVRAAEVGYLNLHGTASDKNDAIEAQVVAEIFPARTRASSTKGWTGHTLGAAGIVESVFALLALREGVLPGTLDSVEPDPACGPQVRFGNAERTVRYAMNNSFGFGGNNCSLLFGAPR
jgi:3-oxoacyl-[acyl-carrier-protein] synthase-1